MPYEMNTVWCEKCGETEGIGADDPRHRFDLFTFNYADREEDEQYTCNTCGAIAKQEYNKSEEG